MTFRKRTQLCNHWRVDRVCVCVCVRVHHAEQLQQEDFVKESLCKDNVECIPINLQESDSAETVTAAAMDKA